MLALSTFSTLIVPIVLRPADCWSQPLRATRASHRSWQLNYSQGNSSVRPSILLLVGTIISDWHFLFIVTLSTTQWFRFMHVFTQQMMRTNIFVSIVSLATFWVWTTCAYTKLEDQLSAIPKSRKHNVWQFKLFNLSDTRVLSLTTLFIWPTCLVAVARV